MSEPVMFGNSKGIIAYPDLPKAPAVVIAHEWWGMSEFIEHVVAKWAKAGFIAIAVDLFHGKKPKNVAEAQAAMQGLDFPHAIGELVGAVEYAKTHARSTGKVAITGYCLGGALTFLTATAAPGLAAAVPFYGLPPQGDWAKVTAPVQAHFARHDDWATVAGAEKVQSQVKAMDLFVYDAKHAFCRDTDPETYNAACATQAWDRAVAFVRQHTA